MLCLGRKEGESILIGNIRVVVVLARNGKAKLAIDAPKTTPVHREEVAAKIAAAKREEVERVWGKVSVGSEASDGK